MLIYLRGAENSHARFTRRESIVHANPQSSKALDTFVRLRATYREHRIRKHLFCESFIRHTGEGAKRWKDTWSRRVHLRHSSISILLAFSIRLSRVVCGNSTRETRTGNVMPDRSVYACHRQHPLQTHICDPFSLPGLFAQLFSGARARTHTHTRRSTFQIWRASTCTPINRRRVTSRFPYQTTDWALQSEQWNEAEPRFRLPDCPNPQSIVWYGRNELQILLPGHADKRQPHESVPLQPPIHSLLSPRRICEGVYR